MSRVKYVNIGDEPLDLERKYTLVTRGYMARGKDGYTSLLVEPEGGECEEVVSEENGVLISTILRQYFLSLKIIGKWKLWSPSLDRQWRAVNDKIHNHHPVKDPNPSTLRASGGGARGDDMESLDESEGVTEVKVEDTESARREKELVTMRRVIKKWWRLAGLKGHPQLCDEQGDGEFMVNWTKVSFTP
jgi:5'-nucleotidase